MTGDADRCLGVTCRTVITGCNKMLVMGELAILGSVASITGVKRFDHRLASRYARDMAAGTSHVVGVGVVVMGQSHGAGHVMTAGTGRRRAVTCRAITGSGRDMDVVGELTVLGAMTRVTLVVGLDDRLAAWYARDVAAGTVHIVYAGVVVMGQGQGTFDVVAAGAGWCGAMASGTVASGSCNMGIVGELVILGGMAGITSIVRLNNR